MTEHRGAARLRGAPDPLRSLPMGPIGLLEAAPDAIVVVSADGAIVDLNTRTSDLFGRARATLLGQPIETLIPERFRSQHTRQVREYFLDPVVRPMGAGLQLFGLRDDGTEFPVEISLNPLHEDGQLHAIAAIRDVTDRRAIEAELRQARDHLEAQVAERTSELARSHQEAQRERDRARRILDVAGVMMVGIGADETVQIINRAGAELLGQPAENIVGKNWFDHFLPEEIREDMRAIFRDLLAGRLDPIHREENAVLCMDGSKRTISWHNTVLIEDDGVKATLSSGADVTDHRRAERALREAENLAQLGKMAAVVAHEIKNPLAAVSGALEVVRDDLDEAGPQRKIVDDVIARLRGLAATVKDLLDFARPTAPEPVSIPLTAIVQSTINLLQQDPQMAGLELVVAAGPECVVRGDVQQLNRLLYNLLLNAGQAMEGAGRVEISTEPDGAYCRIEIRDHGPGIPEEKLPHIFEPFYTTKVRGTGLGLPTSRRIVESHGGHMEITFPEGGGTCVRVWLATDDGEESRAP